MTEQESNSLRIHSYPKVYALGHRWITDLFDGNVVVQEKIDGSQFSFGNVESGLLMRSRSAEVLPGAAGMFGWAAEYLPTVTHLMPLGVVFRCEYLSKPKHNTLAYDRIPTNHLMLFDVELEPNNFGTRSDIDYWAKALGIEAVPDLSVEVDSLDKLEAALKRTSVLGGQQIEGLVWKNYERFGADSKILVGKYVSEAFKEVHRGDWKQRNPSRSDVVSELTRVLTSEARWNKAVQRMREAGELQEAPQDIGPLIKSIREDISAEETDLIKDKLFEWAWPQIQRGVIAGFPEWYKAKLAEVQFENPSNRG